MEDETVDPDGYEGRFFEDPWGGQQASTEMAPNYFHEAQADTSMASCNDRHDPLSDGGMGFGTFDPNDYEDCSVELPRGGSQQTSTEMDPSYYHGAQAELRMVSSNYHHAANPHHLATTTEAMHSNDYHEAQADANVDSGNDHHVANYHQFGAVTEATVRAPRGLYTASITSNESLLGLSHDALFADTPLPPSEMLELVDVEFRPRDQDHFFGQMDPNSEMGGAGNVNSSGDPNVSDASPGVPGMNHHGIAEPSSFVPEIRGPWDPYNTLSAYDSHGGSQQYSVEAPNTYGEPPCPTSLPSQIAAHSQGQSSYNISQHTAFTSPIFFGQPPLLTSTPFVNNSYFPPTNSGHNQTWTGESQTLNEEHAMAPNQSCPHRHSIQGGGTNIGSSSSMYLRTPRHHPYTLSQYGDFEPNPASPVSTRSAATSFTPTIIECDHDGCHVTFKGDYRRGNYMRHIRVVHVTRIYLCEEEGCGKEYKRSDARLKHYRRRHPHLADDPRPRN